MKKTVNNRMLKTALSVLAVFALFASTTIPVFAQTARHRSRVRRSSRSTVHKVPIPAPTPTPAPIYYSVNAGQGIRVRMNQTITSETARVGDQFATTVVDPLYSGGVEIIPAGSTIMGQVRTVERAARKSKAGTMGVHFVSLRLPSGIARAITGDLTDVATRENINADNEGQVSGESATKRNVVFIGGGAATGALIGAIAGGGKGAGIGAGIGAGAGVAGALFSKGHVAVVKSGTEFGVILNQAVTLPAATAR